ncbi:MAG TPA: 1-phosphofructokinase [Virgibacillus sp.]|nr:1-phosphofructokinase [Virgibacillus sp.]
MIYTLTLNPSLDYIMELQQVTLGELNRSQTEAKFPGGKGINVSQVLNTMDVDTRALGFIGGRTGDFIEEFLHSCQIRTDFVRIDEDTRINVKLKSGKETEINASGPIITDSEFELLKNKINALNDEDILVLAGSIPSSLSESTYEDLVKICQKNGTQFVVDAEGDCLSKVLSFQPFLIKPNHHELGALFDTDILTNDDAIHYGKKLIEMGAQHVIVSLAGAGAVLICQNTSLIATAPKGEVRGSVGAGDSMVAGFIAVYQQTKSLETAFRYSVAAGSATAFSVGLCTKEKVEELVPQVDVKNS